uniref:DUF2723 domain-containing protein n=1 Tax=Mucilaginibacter sp. TaxID=1882438 RepID=UPI0035BC32BB
WSFFLGVITVAIIWWGVIQFTVKCAAFSDLLFVNTLGMGFGSGAIVFFLLVAGALIAGIYYTIKPSTAALATAIACFVLLLGISAGIIGLIGAAAALAFFEYVLKVREKRAAVNRVLICAVFILFGYSSFVMIVIRAKAGTNLNNSNPQDAFALNSYLNRDQYGDTPLMYGEYFDSKPIDQNDGPTIYRKGATKYESAGKKLNTIYDRNTLFPRMFSQKPNHPQFYREWSHLGPEENPTMATNLGFFTTWQINQMYTRYFLWNFVGRTNEMDGQQNSAGIDGAWISGINPKKPLPKSVTESNAYNRLYFLPLIIGLLGLVYHFKRNQRDAGVVVVLFFFTGLAIVLYLNQDPLQPRERDYAYAGSFYAFAIWIGLGVLMIAEFISKKLNARTGAMIATSVCLLAAPVLMASQEWDDHDRSTKMTPHDSAYNYLNSCAPNAILFCFADNDTYPLWYIQEVEGVRPDVRIVNLSLLGTDWYIRQMKQKMNDSEPLPITMPYDKFKTGVRDVIYYNDAKVNGPTELKEVFDFITSDDPQTKAQLYEGVDAANYLPTKNLKLTVNADEVIKAGAVPASERARIVPEIDFTFPAKYVTKDNLAIMDIIAHNNWKRPIYFTVTAGNENMLGLDKYFYNEGLALRLMPFAPDTTRQPMEYTNTQSMYNNVMNKFKYGNYKTAKNLDHESLTLFFRVFIDMFTNLGENLLNEGKNDEAKKVVKKYATELPVLVNSSDIAYKQSFMAQTAFRAGETAIATDIVNKVDDYLVDQLNYSNQMLQKGADEVNARDVQFHIQLLNNLVVITKNFNQPKLNSKFDAQLKDYINKFGGLPMPGQ